MYTGSLSPSVCGERVDFVMNLGRRLWRLALSDTTNQPRKGGKNPNFRIVKRDILFNNIACPKGISPEYFIEALARKGYCQLTSSGNEIRIASRAVNFYHLANVLTSCDCAESDIRYFIRRNIRRTYSCEVGPDIVRAFSLLADTLNRAANEYYGKESGRGRVRWHHETLHALLHNALGLLKGTLPSDDDRVDANGNVGAFIETCQLVGYLKPHNKPKHVVLRTASVDAEYLLARLFGLPTEIRGLDDLFGGGGLMLSEDLPGKHSVNGRSILLQGRYGTGKSALCLQLSWEVARKGGVAWVMPIEQTPEDCIRVLHTLGDNTTVPGVNIVTQPSDMTANWKEGALIILPTLKESYDDFLTILEHSSKTMAHYPLRLLVIDPINSIHKFSKSGLTERRSQTFETLDKLKSHGTNLLIVSEEHSSDAEATDFGFGTYLCDTAIRLSVQSRHDYAQRYFEITKSRFQREHRGEHPFAIIPGKGVHIATSSASIASRVQRRTWTASREAIDFGPPVFDNFPNLGLKSGDLIVLHGVVGTYKTELCAYFALGCDIPLSRKKKVRYSTLARKYRSLVVTSRERRSRIEAYVDKYDKYYSPGRKERCYKQPSQIKYCVLPSGYIQPGYLLGAIEEQFSQADADNAWIDRIVIHNVSDWESYPFVAEDVTFPDTLVSFLRAYCVTSLLACGDRSSTSPSKLLDAISASADCIMRFDRPNLVGSNEVVFRILKSPKAQKGAESFTIRRSNTKLSVYPTLPTRKMDVWRTQAPMSIRFSLKTETTAQRAYNQRVLAVAQAFLGKGVFVSSSGIREGLITRLTTIRREIDELQLVELEESYLPLLRQESRDLTLTPLQLPLPKSASFLPWLSASSGLHSDRWLAFPYYENITLLLYRDFSLAAAPPSSWEQLADLCRDWEKDNKSKSSIFFDFARKSPDDYCSLFFEILFSLTKFPTTKAQCGLASILRTPEAVGAALILRDLCRRAYLLRSSSDSCNSDQQDGPIVAHHWYSTLSDAVSKNVERQSHVGVAIAPPGGLAVGNATYLGLPAYSAAPGLGVEIITSLVTYEAGVERMILGVGLPTRREFYELKDDRGKDMRFPVSPALSLELPILRELLRSAFRLSRLGCYRRTRKTLAFALECILKAQSSIEGDLTSYVSAVLATVSSSIEVPHGFDETCLGCHTRLH
jgi:KaiC/GvpD/RAD55 family RecA-like ATPase